MNATSPSRRRRAPHSRRKLPAGTNAAPPSTTRSTAPHLEHSAARTMPIREVLLRERLGADYGCELYIATVDGDCLEPEIYCNDHVVVAPTLRVRAGDYVVLWPKNPAHQPQVKRVVLPPMDGWAGFTPEWNVARAIIVEQFNPRRQYQITTDRLAAIHRVVLILSQDGAERLPATAPRKRVAVGAGGLSEFDPFALGGCVHPDIDLLAAEQEFHQLEAQVNALEEADADEEAEVAPVFLRWMDVRDKIAQIPPATLEGAAVKLRVLLHDEVGIEAGDNEHDVPSLRQVLASIEAGVERIAGGSRSMAAPDLFAVAGRKDDVAALRRRIADLTDELLGLCKSLPSEPIEPARPPPEPVTEAELEALRVECEAIAALYRAPLPKGDAGLVAAVQRWRDLRPRLRLAECGFNLTVQTEHDIAEPIAYAAEIALQNFIEETPASHLAGVAAKLRYQVELMGKADTILVDIEQLAEVVERAIEPAPGGIPTGSGRVAA